MTEQSSGGNRAYFAQRAAEEFDRAASAADAEAAAAHRKLQMIYLERASVGDRDAFVPEEIG